MKLRKVLTVVLMLAVIVSAFAVMSFAAEGDTALDPKRVASSTVGNGDFTDAADKEIYYDKEGKLGRFVVRKSGDGNVYILSQYAPVTGTGTDKDNLDVYASNYNNNGGYGFKTHSFLAIDFDVMTENGTYGDYASLGPAIYSAGSRVFTLSGTKFAEMKLSTTPYEWQHVTCIIEYAGDGMFYQHYYVNGVHKVTSEHDRSEESGYTGLNGDDSKLSLGYIRLYPSSNASKDGHIGLDNLKFTYFPTDYCKGDDDLTDIATYYYNDSYALPYKYTVATVTDADKNTVVYDDINKAIAAAGENDTVKLFESVTTPVTVDKSFYLDRNVYDENGNKTGNLYDFNFVSSKALVTLETEEGSGIFTFVRSATAIDVIWDEACEGECDCYAQFGGHGMTDTTIVSVGEVPTYFGDIPEYVSVNGFVKKFVGWSYEKGGEAVELTALTDADLMLGTVKLYPVYTAIQYDLEYTDEDGNSEFYFENEFDEAITRTVSTDGAKLTLHSDIEFYTKVVLQSGIKSTLDLNGHNLTRINVYGSSYRYDTASGDYVAGADVSSHIDAFTATLLTESEFTLTSSKAGSTFKTASVNGTVWYDENGKVVKYEGASVAYAGLFQFSKPNSSTVNISNITVHAVDVLYLSDGNTKNFTLNMDGVDFYKTVGAETTGKYGYGCFFIDTVNTVTFNVDNSLFYFPASSVISSNGQFIRMLAKEGKTNTFNATFNNCDIISDNSSVAVALNKTTHSVVFNNCRIYNIKNSDSTYPVTFGNDTVSSDTIGKNSKAQDGHHIVKASNSKTYSLPTMRPSIWTPSMPAPLPSLPVWPLPPT